MRWVAFSTIFAGITGYLVIYLATSSLGAGKFDGFNVMWGLFFAISGIVQGLMHETTRGVRAATTGDRELIDENDNGIHDADELVLSDSSTGTTVFEVLTPEEIAADRARRAAADAAVADAAPDATADAATVRPLFVTTFVGLGFAAALAATSWWWGPALLPKGEVGLGIVLICVSTFLLTVQAGLAGLLSGTGRWRPFGMLLTAEAALRVLVAGAAVASEGSMAGFMYATVAGVIATPIALVVATPCREVMRMHADVGLRRFLRNGASAMAAAAGASLLVVGFPVLMRATRADADPVVLSNLLLAVLLTRAPILTPITSFQNALVVHFVDRRDQGMRALLAPSAIVIAVGLVGAFLAWLLGPTIFELMGDGFQIGGDLLAALTFAASITGLLYVTGAATLARERHGQYVIGWWVAAIVSIVLLLVVPGLVAATVAALVVGPAAGVLTHILIGLRGSRAALNPAPTAPGIPAVAEPTEG